MSHQAVFPPAVLARIAPDVSLSRHMALGLRPCLREFDEFRPISANQASLSDSGSLVGSATAKNGSTHAFCGISMGIAEVSATDDLLAPSNSQESENQATIYPMVEIARGRSGAPTDEEMILSQQLHNTVYHSRLLPQRSLELVPGYQLTNDETGQQYVVYPDDNSSEAQEDLSNMSSTINVSRKKYQFVLYAHIKVFSRTGPLFDLVHYVLVAALKSVKLPRVYMADSGIDPNIRIPVRSRGNFGHLAQAASQFCVDPAVEPIPLALSESIGVSSSFGVVEQEEEAKAEEDTQEQTKNQVNAVLLADLEGEAEEACAESRISVVATPKDLHHVSIVGGGANVTLDTLRTAVAIAKRRAGAVEH